MRVAITARHTEISDEIRGFAEERVRHLEHLSPRIIDGHLVIDVERRNFLAEININVGHYRINCRAKHRDLQAAIEGVIKKTEKKLRKLKTKFEKRKRAQPLSSAAPSVPPLPDNKVAEEIPDLIKEKDFVLRTLSKDEVVHQLRASRINFLLFREARTNKPSIIYRRSDGKLGLIELEE